MKLSTGLSPTLQSVVGELTTAGVDTPKGAKAKDAADLYKVSQKAPRHELQSVALSVAQQIGLDSTKQLATVTQSQCMDCYDDPMEGAVAWALVMAFQIHCKPVSPKKLLPKRKEPLAALDVDACAGLYRDPPRARTGTGGRDPLILIFDNIEPTTEDAPTKIFMTNRSNLDEPKAIELPTNLFKAVDGKYALVLGDEWMEEHGIKPGHVLELQQTKGEGKGRRKSPSTFVKVNPEGPGREAAPALPPHDVVGQVQMRAQFEKLLDPKPGAVRAERMQVTAGDEDGKFQLCNLDGQYALEPFSQVMVTNLSQGKSSEKIEVAEDGTFLVPFAANKGDALLIRTVDHSHEFGDRMFERRLTMTAGDTCAPMLAQNPELQADGPVTINIGGLTTSDDCQQLESNQAVSPGSVVTISRAGHEDDAITAIADQNGRFFVDFPFEPHAEDVIDLEVKSPFNVEFEHLGAWQQKAAASVRLELNEDGSLDKVRAKGAVNDGADAVAPLDNVDHVESGTAVPIAPFLAVNDLTFNLNSYNRRTESSGKLNIDQDEGSRTQLSASFDNAKQEVVVRVHNHGAGGWPGEVKEGEDVGISLNADQVTNGMFRVKQGETVNVRFERPDGVAFATAAVERQAADGSKHAYTMVPGSFTDV